MRNQSAAYTAVALGRSGVAYFQIAVVAVTFAGDGSVTGLLTLTGVG